MFLEKIKKFFASEAKETPEDLEKEYLTENPSEIYSFQKKFYNQSDRLYSVYGDAFRSVFPKVKLIVITDTHNMLDLEKLKNITMDHPDFDACILLGDHTSGDIEKVLSCIDKSKIYSLLGNHDYDYINGYGLNNLNGRVVNINGVNILGIEGSFRYKLANFPSFSQEESIRFLNSKERVDILFSHDGPFDDTKINNPAHQGLFGITYYLFKKHVKYNVHGHLHEDFRKTLKNGTEEIGLFGVNYIELD